MSDQQERNRQALIGKFKVIVRERLERLNNCVITLERDPGNEQAASTVMREIHTLKGEAKLMGFADINLVAHRIEDLLIAAKKGGFRFSADLGDLVLRGFDIIGYLLKKQAGAESSQVDLGAFMARADHLLLGEKKPEAPVEKPLSGQQPSPHALSELPDKKLVRVDIEKLDKLTDLAGDLLHDQQWTMEVTSSLGKIAESWLHENLHYQAFLGSQGRPEDITREQLIQVVQYLSRWLVNLRKLHTEFTHMVDQFREHAFEKRARFDELEGSIRELRLLPLASLFAAYPRAIRDLAKEQGKQVKITVEGGDLEMDKQVLNMIGEPLLHLIRNAVDHGIESPKDRLARGKLEEGHVGLSARHLGTQVEIAVSDDGRGISVEEMRETAIASGVVTSEEAELLGPDELRYFIFRSGFSTRRKATDVSGRGIGLDVVKERVEELGGSVRVESDVGRGTRVVMNVPTSIALMRALVVGVGDELFAFPSNAIGLVAEISEDQMTTAGNGKAFRLDGALVPLGDLAALLGLPSEGPTENGLSRVVVIQSQGRRLGLQLANVLGERELVQRPLGRFLDAIPVFIGAAVLELDQPTFILNVSEIIRRSVEDYRPRVVSVKPGPTTPRERTVLVVEDSELTRDMMVSMLLGRGFRVVEATDGRDAMERVQSGKPDLVLTDLEMPVMDGFELITQLRATPGLQEIPVVVVSSRGSEEDKRRAAQAGADAYLVKSDFHETALMETVSRLLPGGDSPPEKE